MYILSTKRTKVVSKVNNVYVVRWNLWSRLCKTLKSQVKIKTTLLNRNVKIHKNSHKIHKNSLETSRKGESYRSYKPNMNYETCLNTLSRRRRILLTKLRFIISWFLILADTIPFSLHRAEDSRTTQIS